MTSIQEVLADHQKSSLGMSSGTPDTCKCGTKIYPTVTEDEGVDIMERRDTAFAVHQTQALASHGLIDVDFYGHRTSGYPKVSRIEVIDNSRRALITYGAREVFTALQDEDRTLKVFMRTGD